MPPFDRDAALKSAEKALRLGRIDAAIAEYQKIVDAQPRDWNSANALGDLYVRGSQVDKGIEQYTRIADHLAAEGFFPKAAALYKKILKFKPDQEYALLQSGEIAAKQGLLADAKNAFRLVADRRRGRGDAKGAAEVVIRAGTLDPDDLDARLSAARAAAEIGDTATALREFRDVGYGFEKQNKATDALSAFQAAFDIDPGEMAVRGRLLEGYLAAGDLARSRGVASGTGDLKRIASALEAAGRQDDMLEVLAEVAQLDPTDLQVRADLALAYFARGDHDTARTYLDARTAGHRAPLWLTLAEIEFLAERANEGRAAVTQALSIDPSARAAALALGIRLTEASPDAAYPCFDAIADVALRKGEYSAAASALHEFVTRTSGHVVALMRLVEICVDGGLEATMQQAQAQLADAYLGVGRGLEARIISEDLVAREPWNTENIERFRRALVMLGETDPDGIIAERLSGDSPFMATDKMDLNEGVFFNDRPAAAPPPSSPVPILFDEEELIDLDAAIDDDVLAPMPVEPEAPAPSRPAQAPPPAVSAAVEPSLPDEVSNGSEDEVAAEQFGLAMTYRELGMIDDAIQALEVAAGSARQRFEASAMLAALYLERDEVDTAIQWFERAAEAPAPTGTAGRALLYDFAETLEKSGRHARALAVFVELEAEAGGYRDVAYRILRLSKLQAKR